MRRTIALVLLLPSCYAPRTIRIDRDFALDSIEFEASSIEVVSDDGVTRSARARGLSPDRPGGVLTNYRYPVLFGENRPLAEARAEWARDPAWKTATLQVDVLEPVRGLAVGGAALGGAFAGGLLGARSADCRPRCAEDTEGLSLFFGSMLGAVVGTLVGGTAAWALYESGTHSYGLQ
jgi:hypothetical protein